MIEGIAIPEDIAEAIVRFLSNLGERDADAVRSIATAEDLPTAFFAGHKTLAIYALKEGGTTAQKIEPEQQNQRVLTDDQIVSLERLPPGSMKK
nr:PEP/pyruvate-binding domain-containing protein [Kovacikia minuta]